MIMDTTLDLNKLKLKKFAYTMMLKNKIRDVKPIYEYGYKLNLTDENITMILTEIGF
jgi:hypothetical protein